MYCESARLDIVGLFFGWKQLCNRVKVVFVHVKL